MSAVASLSRIGFIGAGRVAQTLASAFARSNYQVVAVSSRSQANLAGFCARFPAGRGELAAGSPQEVVDRSSIVFLTVSDDAIAPVCASLKWRAGVAAVHCSGATEIAALQSAREAGAFVGAFHPMQMFANPDVALASLPGCTVGIESDEELRDDLHDLARAIHCVPFSLPPGVRPLYHASAYYVGPFLVALLSEGSKLWKRFGATERQAMKAMMPLLHGTLAAVMDDGLARGMGGCVARGDIGTIRKHLDALENFDLPAASLYRELAARNVPLALERGTLSPASAKKIQELLQH